MRNSSKIERLTQVENQKQDLVIFLGADLKKLLIVNNNDATAYRCLYFVRILSH